MGKTPTLVPKERICSMTKPKATVGSKWIPNKTLNRKVLRRISLLKASPSKVGGGVFFEGSIQFGIEGNPLYSPLALVLIGGLISSTLLSRLVTPVMYKLLPPRVEVVEVREGDVGLD